MLLDFGIAQLQEQGEAAGERTLALTPRYASPEQRAGAAPGPASDIYSLGRVIEELLAAPAAMTARPAEWRAIVARACADDPADRYPTVQALTEDLHRYEAHLPLRALPAPVFDRAMDVLGVNATMDGLTGRQARLFAEDEAAR